MLDFNKNILIKTTIAILVLLILLVALLAFLSSSPEDISVDTIIRIEDLEAEFDSRVQIENYYEELLIRNPLIGKLPYRGDKFEVHYGTESEESFDVFYPIVLLPVTQSSRGNAYIAEVNLLTERSKTWIRGQGFNPDSLDIEWVGMGELFEYVPFTGQKFEVRFKEISTATSDAKYTITLKPKLNPGDDGFKKEIEAIVESVNSWIESKGINPEELSIEWVTE